MKNITISAIIQARMSSTRLPGKVLKKIGNRTILEIIIRRLKKSKQIDSIVVATTREKIDDPIAVEAKGLSVGCFRGSRDNVLKRFIGAARDCAADVIVRVTADNPLVDPWMMDRLIAMHLKNKADYTYCAGVPLGVGVEVVNPAILKNIYVFAKSRADREHVTFYILNHPRDFKIQVVSANSLGLYCPHLRLTIDTPSDFRMIKKINQGLGGLENLKSKELIAYLRRHPDISKINSGVKQKAPKNKKEITVIVRTYNSQDFVRNAIESVIRQSIPADTYEILVVDDGSGDSTKNILMTYKEKIRLIEQKNRGYVNAINTGITNAVGRYIILLDADDTFEPGILYELLGAFKKENGLGFVYSDYYEKNLDTGSVRTVSLRNIFNSTAGGIMFKKSILREFGMYDESFIFPEYDLLIKIMEKYKGRHIPKPLFTYYRHGQSLTASKERVRMGRDQLFEKYGPIKALRQY